VDNKIAFFENQQLMTGSPVPVVTNELHSVHLQTHVPALMQLIEQLNTGASDPVQALPALQAFYQHIAETAQQLAADPAQAGMVGEANQALQFAEEMINNTTKQVQKMQREAAQAEPEAGGGGEPQVDQALAAKMQEHQIKMQIAQQKAELDMQIKRAKFDQEQAMRDAKNAMEMTSQ
tara:strand:- start:568 stop:1101 length:534 start_codon:yes stop_codon:yes gene_type:complete